MKKFSDGPFHIFNGVPTNEAETSRHASILSNTGYYPAGTDGCFNVGISGGCGPDCFVYLRGECGEPDAMIDQFTADEMERHRSLYKDHTIDD